MQTYTSMNGSRHTQRLTHTHIQAYAPTSTCSNKAIHSHTIIHSYLHGHSPTHPFTCVESRESHTHTQLHIHTRALTHTHPFPHLHVHLLPRRPPPLPGLTSGFLGALFMYEPAHCRLLATTLLLLQAGTMRIFVVRVSLDIVV